MTATVAHILPILERLAPSRLAESWDNVGLQIGSLNWPVKRIWTALDPLPEVVEKACQNDVDLLVTHHPLFFKAIKRIDADSPAGRVAQMALGRKLAIYSAHTNLDSVAGGVNDVLAERVGLTNLCVLSGGPSDGICKLVVFVPGTHVKEILDTLFAMEAGHLGNYTCCSFRCDGVGTFLPGQDTSPAFGKVDALNQVEESRIEILLARADEKRVVSALEKVHPYETMAYDLYPVSRYDTQTGLGRVGELSRSMSLEALTSRLKTTLNLTTAKVVGSASPAIRRVAVCSGSGGSLLAAAVAAGAQAYVSGDLGYHTARDAQQAGIALIDVGHFASERLIVDVLAKAIETAIADAGVSATVAPADLETDPFEYL
ncbi:GTP cyclohydrolase 1 type 2 [Desulfosarcina ovata subsp. ovata]|uniref:GTP cyclohydrolase 1 type 2 homolog n=2 Tax=Desulfosarcina ovata TaxID=83564 RepID=A0A5K8A5D7_9BACT|nr:GTP cyclohydrolase 1 type 2 [Desulfosarcina ovata subsp. ovata]